MISGARLVAISGGATRSAGARMLSIGAGANAGDRLKAWSGLPLATAAVHLMTDPVSTPSGGTPIAGFIVNVGSLLTR